MSIIKIIHYKRCYMSFYGDYHTHTYLSDGVSSIKENAVSAIEKGLKEIAITDHGFNSPSYGALSRDKFKKQTIEIADARRDFGDRLNILHGIEADIIGLDGTIDLNDDELEHMEVLVLGYHSFARAISFRDWRKIFINSYLSFIFTPSKETIKRNTKTLINAIKRYPIDIIAHINHLFKVDCMEVAKACSDYGTYIELNVKHMNLSDESFQKMLSTGVQFIANTDAHHFSAVGNFEKIEMFLKKHNYELENLTNYRKQPEFGRRKSRIKEL